MESGKKLPKSNKDAQSFRKKDDDKLNIVEIKPYIYHYGWVRPPEMMQSKKKEQDSMHHGIDKIEDEYKLKANEFDYGLLGKIPVFKDSHPAVMNEFITKMHWGKKLNQTKKGKLNRDKMKHEKTKYRIISFFENTLNGGKDFFGYTNWHVVK